MKSVTGDSYRQHQHQCIIHVAKFLDEYVDCHGSIQKFSDGMIQLNHNDNHLLAYMYDYLKKKLPNAIVIDCCEQFYACENHKWGLATMHYIEEYYKTVLGKIYQNIKQIQ